MIRVCIISSFIGKHNRYNIICLACVLLVSLSELMLMMYVERKFYSGLKTRFEPLFAAAVEFSVVSRATRTAQSLVVGIETRVTRKRVSPYRIACESIPTTRRASRWHRFPVIPIRIFTSGLQRQISIFGPHWQLEIEKQIVSRRQTTRAGY